MHFDGFDTSIARCCPAIRTIIQPYTVIYKIARNALNGLAGPATKGIAAKTGGKSSGGDTGDLVAHVPGVGRGTADLRQYRHSVKNRPCCSFMRW